MKKIILVPLLVVGLLCAAFGAQAQAAAYERAVIENVGVDMPYLDIYFNIMDEDNHIRTDKSVAADQVGVYLGDEKLDVEGCVPYADSEAGTAYFFMVDISGSARRGFSGVRDAILSWAEQKKPGDRIILLTFGERVGVLLDGTEDGAAIREAVQGMKAADSQTRYFDCVSKALSIAQSADLPARKVFIAVTDGEECSRGGATLDEIADKLEQADIPLYHMAVPGSSGGSVSTMGRLSRSTDARVISLSGSNAAKAFGSLRDELQSGFVVTAKAKNNIIDDGTRTLYLTVRTDIGELSATETVRLTSHQQDTVLPEIVSVEALNSKNIAVTYSEDVAGADVAGNFTVRNAQGASLAILSTSYDNGRTLIVLDAPLADGEYALETANIRDVSMERNPVSNPGFAFTVSGMPVPEEEEAVPALALPVAKAGLELWQILLIAAAALILILALVILIILLLAHRKKARQEPAAEKEPEQKAAGPEANPELQEVVMGFAQGAATGIKRLNEKIENYTALIDEQQKELARYKEGYMYSSNKSAVSRMIRLIEEIDDMPPDDNLTFVKKQLLYSLETNGIVPFAPDTGEAYDSSRHRFAGSAATDDAVLHNRIARVIHPGYRIEIAEDQHRILVPAEVEVYVKS